MRVIDCNECGETLKAANDDELTRELSSHMKSDHPDSEFDGEQAAGLIEEQAYSATDS
jgi:predicted small metal-binding protein